MATTVCTLFYELQYAQSKMSEISVLSSNLMILGLIKYRHHGCKSSSWSLFTLSKYLN